RAGVLAACSLLLAGMYWQWSAMFGISLDDAFITFRYADHWAKGSGPTYNPGEHVEGYSNFLWLTLLALCRLFADDLDRPSQALGAIAASASVVLAPWAVRRVYGVQHRAALTAVALAVATSGYVAAWAVSGLETALYGMLLLITWTDLAWEREPAAQRP